MTSLWAGKRNGVVLSDGSFDDTTLSGERTSGAGKGGACGGGGLGVEKPPDEGNDGLEAEAGLASQVADSLLGTGVAGSGAGAGVGTIDKVSFMSDNGATGGVAGPCWSLLSRGRVDTVTVVEEASSLAVAAPSCGNLSEERELE
jgi:hypothetical protein